MSVLDRLKWLANYGRSSENGITRLVYTNSWYEAQKALSQWLESEGFEVHFDSVGNVIATISGTDQPNEIIMTGSHIDTVKDGGIYDGQLGIIGGALAILNLIHLHGLPKKTLRLVAFAEEEGSRFPFAMWGSKSMFGQATIEEVANIFDENHISFLEAMQKYKFPNQTISKEESIHAFIELHIEQGIVLEKEKMDIGIVESIVGQRRFNIKVQGESNHAGTTPMNDRHDAMYAASKMISKILDIAANEGNPLVATVGKMEIYPNIPNVIPGEVLFTLDVRHTDNQCLQKICNKMVQQMNETAEKFSVDLKIDTWFQSEPAYMNQALLAAIEKSCIEKQLSYKRMHSGAAHDSQIVCSDVPTAMIFAPSKNGISHSPLEFTEEDQLEKGVDLLTDVLRKLVF